MRSRRKRNGRLASEPNLRGRVRHGDRVLRKHRREGHVLSKRARGVQVDDRQPFAPPEDWHEPRADATGYRVVTRQPGDGYRHAVTPQEVRDRLAELPQHFLESLEVVQLSRITRKKRSLPCYGMQWGPAIYLYPMEENLVETYHRPPKPAQLIEARMYGGVWQQSSRDTWTLSWSPQAIKDFYLNNILIHELGHLLDDRNSSYVDRERYAEWFAIRYGASSRTRRTAESL